MARGNKPLYAFNRGIVSKLALARLDVERVSLAAEIQENWMPRKLGAMMLRPGMQKIGGLPSAPYLIPFVFAQNDMALIQFTNEALKVWVDDAPVTRAAVTASVTNGTFDTDLSGWTDEDETDATSSYSSGQMSLAGSGFNYAIRRQSVAITEETTEHALRIKVARGVVLLKLGTSAGDDSIRNASLGAGEHSIAFTPNNSTLHIELSNAEKRVVLVDSVEMESAGELSLPVPYTTSDLPYIRFDQSLDVVYVSCLGCPQKKIERRSATSWSVVDYLPLSGPFEPINATSITLTPSALDGNITLTASKPVFKSGHVGALFKIDSSGQTVEATISGEDQFTDSIRVTGALTSRTFNFSISGTFSATVTLQRSVGAEGSWEDVISFSAAHNDAYNDELTNELIYYRIGVKSGGYTSGSARVSIVFSGGSSSGVARVLSLTSNTVVDAEVLDTLGNTSGSTDWYEGAWSTEEGYPSSVCLAEGRLWWFGRNRVWGSESDLYEEFDPDTEGASAPIDRTIGRGPVDEIHWAVALNRLMVGTAGSVLSFRSSSLDEPLTGTDFSPKDASTQGAAQVDIAKIDMDGVYVHRSGTKLYYLSFSGPEYQAVDLTTLAPDIFVSPIKRVVVQRQPDTRVHCIMNNGDVIVLVIDSTEELRAFVKVTTDGDVEDAVVLPGDEEDQVYYAVSRTNGRYLEKWALESQARGGEDNRIGDGGVAYTDLSEPTLSGLDHLEGQDVVVWGNSKSLGTFTVTDGAVTVGETITGKAYAGLYYKSDYKNAKLSSTEELWLAQTKKISHLALILADTHAQGLKYGPSFDQLDELPLVEDGAVVDPDSIWDQYDFRALEFDGEFESDPRLCLRAEAPKPCTVLAAIPGVETHAKV